MLLVLTTLLSEDCEGTLPREWLHEHGVADSLHLTAVIETLRVATAGRRPDETQTAQVKGSKEGI